MIDFDLLICIKPKTLEIILSRLFFDDINFWSILASSEGGPGVSNKTHKESFPQMKSCVSVSKIQPIIFF